MQSTSPLPLGKLPPDLLRDLLKGAPQHDSRIVLGPQVGSDCAVINLGTRMLVLKSDPITFASEEIGWYLVQVNANDIATTGATPRWLLLTMLLPETKTTADTVKAMATQVYTACDALNISVVGGHTEITHGLERPIFSGTLIGEVAPGALITPQGAQPGDQILLTKGVPIEATAILAREVPERLGDYLDQAQISEAQNFLYQPGISILRDAQIAQAAGRVTAMHDPTEGGLAAALWELAEACHQQLIFEPTAVPIPYLAQQVCRAFGLDPLATIASGALLFTAPPGDAPAIREALQAGGIDCASIGRVEAGPSVVRQESGGVQSAFPRPQRDEIGRVYEY